jgi:hypothetical protein
VAAAQHSFVVMEDGSVYSFGCGDHYRCVFLSKLFMFEIGEESRNLFKHCLGEGCRLGHGTTDTVTTPKKIEKLAPFAIQTVSSNGRHTLALT